jgi:hypothetical protein
VDVAFAASTSTVPRSPSTRTSAPSGIVVVPSPVETTHGSPNSRATIAAWLSAPPRSVTIAPISGRSTLNAGEV